MAATRKEKMTFEQALEQLEEIVTKIESGETPLEESIEMYAKGTALVKQCRSILDAAEKKIQLLAADDAGQLNPAGDLPEAEDEDA